MSYRATKAALALGVMRRAAALPRWKLAFEMRRGGARYHELAAFFGVRIPTAHKFVTRYEEFLLDARIAARAAIGREGTQGTQRREA